MVTVLFFATLRDLTGQAEIPFPLEEARTVADVFQELATRHPKLSGYKDSLLIAVNEEYGSWDTPLKEGDEVAFFPPVSGGQEQETVRIVESAIDTATVLGLVGGPEAGAIVTFDGTVRNHARGKSVTHLFYEAYSPMALKEMQVIREEALRRWPIRELAIVHRVGRMEIGESSVFIAASAAHRADAFAACRYAIDTLKQRVPIWKKEFYQDGEIWIEEYAG